MPTIHFAADEVVAEAVLIDIRRVRYYPPAPNRLVLKCAEGLIFEMFLTG